MDGPSYVMDSEGSTNSKGGNVDCTGAPYLEWVWEFVDFHFSNPLSQCGSWTSWLVVKLYPICAVNHWLKFNVIVQAQKWELFTPATYIDWYMASNVYEKWKLIQDEIYAHTSYLHWNRENLPREINLKQKGRSMLNRFKCFHLNFFSWWFFWVTQPEDTNEVIHAWSDFTGSSSSFLCQLQNAWVKFTILSSPWPKLASRKTDHSGCKLYLSNTIKRTKHLSTSTK